MRYFLITLLLLLSTLSFSAQVFAGETGKTSDEASSQTSSNSNMTIYLSTPFDKSKAGCKYYSQTEGKYLFVPGTINAKSDGTCTGPKGEVGMISEALVLPKNGAGVFTALMENYISPLLKWFYGIAATVTVIMVIVGGIQMIVTGDTKSGKERIQKALSALVLLLLSSVILHMVNPLFFTF